VKVEEEASWVGLGWSLSSGGMITRVINGVDDFANGEIGWFANSRGYLNSPEAPGTSDPSGFATFLTQLCKQHEDSRPDVFYYNFNGYSGKFILKKKTTPSSPVEVLMLSNDKMRVSYNTTTKTWTFTTIDGTQYFFGTHEESQSWMGNGSDYQTVFNTAVFPNQIYNSRTITGWHLDKIVSTNGEELLFTYKTGSPSSETYSFTELRSISIARDPDFACQPPKYVQTGTRTGTFLKYLDKIEITGGQVGHGLRVLFNTTDRNDIKAYDAKIQGVYGKAQRLDNIRVEYLDNGYKLYRQINFNSQTDGPLVQSMWDPFKERLWLNSIDFLNAENGKVEKYKFHYDPTSLPVKNSTSVDYWGYYNNEPNIGNAPLGILPTKIPSLILIDGTNLIPIVGANRKPSEKYAKAGVLTKIEYPTGGFTEFDYELNRHYSSSEKVFKLEPQRAEGNESKTFELLVPTLVKLTAELRYLGTNCYPDAGNQQIAYSAVPNVALAAHIHPENNSTTTLFSVGYLHYKDCMLTSSNNPSCGGIEFMGHPNARCGVRRVSGNPVDQTILLQAGRYTLATNSLPNWKASITAEFSGEVLMTSGTIDQFNFAGGGLRIKEIRNFENTGKLAGKKKYSYSKPVRIENGKAVDDETSPLKISSGLNITPLWHHYNDMSSIALMGHMGWGTFELSWTCYQLISTSYSNMPLSNAAQGGLVGYSRVTEEVVGDDFNGTVEYQFINEVDIYSVNHAPQPGAPLKTFEYKNGLLLSRRTFRNDGKLMHEMLNNYNPSSSVVNATCLFSRNTGPCEGSDCFIAPVESPLLYLSCVAEVPTYFSTYYDIRHEFWQLLSVIDRNYDYPNGVQVANQQKREYGYNPDHKMVILENAIISDASKYISTKTTYPLDLTTPPAFFLSKHIHNKPLEVEKFTKEYVGGSSLKTEGIKYIYSEHTDKNGRVLLDQILMYNTTTNGYEIRYKLTYDLAGNIVEIEKDGHFTSFIWGYNNTLPIVKADNVQYSDLILSFNLGQNLRNTFPKAIIQEYTHKPYVGVSSIRDPNEKDTRFEFDSYGRLQSMKDFNGNILFAFNYHFRQ